MLRERGLYLVADHGLCRCSDVQSALSVSKCMYCDSFAPSSVLGLTDAELTGVETCERSREGRQSGATRQGLFVKASFVMKKIKEEELGGQSRNWVESVARAAWL